MIDYITRRILVMIITLMAVSVLIFIVIQLPPGDYLTSYITELESQGVAVDPRKIEYLRTKYGLDQPLWQQYLTWIFGVVQGDFGFSFEADMPVADVIGDVFMLSLLLNLCIVIFTFAVAFPIGIYSATHQYSWGDYGLTFVGFIGLATPNFLLALILMFLAR
ncbi:MAG: ABC transporter permease, partial [Rhodospirillales bacterium]|nr:ABC transporter permease [Rhodospirillales bacterium]